MWQVSTAELTWLFCGCHPSQTACQHTRFTLINNSQCHHQSSHTSSGQHAQIPQNPKYEKNTWQKLRCNPILFHMLRRPRSLCQECLHIPGKRCVGRDTSHCRSRVPLMDPRFLSCWPHRSSCYGSGKIPTWREKELAAKLWDFKMFKSEKGENLEFQTYFCIASWELEAFLSTEWCEGTMVWYD